MANIKWRNDGSGLGDIEGRDDLVMHDMVYRHPIKGAKKDKNAPRKPVIMKDSASSTSIAKIQYGLSEGTIWGLVDGGKSIILDGTPLEAADGTKNFKNVTYDIRLGTNDQTYMQGFPDVSNEVGIGVELKSTAPYVRAINDTQLSAVRVRLRWNGLSSTNPENGDVSGHRIDYAIDLQTDGGAYVEVLNTTISDKVSTGYERTHRIDLPRATTGWQIRIRRLTANSSSEYVRDTMYVDAIAEVIDAKFNYPNTAHMGIEFDSENFRGIPKLEAHVRGMIVRIPTNYDPVTRKYVGIWDGQFKEAYTNNPAWIYYDILTAKRYGLGDRIDTSMVDKWVIYTLGVFCDQLVPDGLGGEEPRFTCNVYLQKTSDAYQVLSSLSGIFRAMAFWNGEKIILDADMPKDPVYTFSRANTVADENGICFNHTGSRLRDRHTVVKVAWDNPNNAFQTEYEYVRDEKAISKYGIRTLDLSAFGCTSQGQAQRAGLWALRTEQLETRQITFSVGLDGFLPQVADVINVADELFAGRANSGRVSNISTGRTVVTLDRDLNVKVGDVLIINGSDGKAERRVVKSVAGRKVTMVAAFTKAEKQNIWALETADLKLMRFRVMSIQENGDSTFNITALQHEPKKFPAIDSGADVIPDNITSITPDIIDAPTTVTITTRHRVVQGVTVTTLVINWGQVKTAVGYDVEWRKDDGNWIKVPRTGNTTVEVEGVYAGRYTAQVRAVSAYDVSSAATFSSVTEVKGKVGLPPAIIGLTVTGVLFGFDLKWSFGAGSGDAAFTEIQVASAPNVNVKQLGLYAYNTNKLQINGLMGNLSQSFRARLVDKLGFTSAWSAWVTGTTSASAAPIMDMIQGQINESSLNQALTSKIDKIETNSSSIGGISTELNKAKADIIATDKVIAANKLEATNAVAAANTELDKAKADIIAADKVIAANKLEAANAVTAANAEISKAKTDIIAADKAITANKLEATNAVAAANKAIADNKLIASNAVAAANAEIAASKAIIDSNKAEISAAKTELNTAKTQLATAVADIGTAKTDITKAKTDIIAAKSVADAAKADAAANKISLVAVNKAVGENKTSVEASITELTNKDLSLSNLYTALKSEYDTNKASVSNSITTLTNKDTSLSNSLTALDTDYKGNKTAIRNELTAVSNKTNSTASSLTSLTTEVGKNKTAISTEATTRATEDTALSNRITTVSGKTDNALSRISTAETAISTNAGAITQQKTDITAAYTKAIDDIEIGGRNLIVLNSLTNHYLQVSGNLVSSSSWRTTDYISATPNSSYVISGYTNLGSTVSTVFYDSNKAIISGIAGSTRTTVISPAGTAYIRTSFAAADIGTIKFEKGNKATDWTPAPEDVEADYNAKISTEATARADADKAITSSVTALKSDYDANKASVTQSLGTLTNKDTALTNQLTALDTDYKGNKTAIRNELTAVSNKADSTANSLSTLTTTVGTNTTKISQESTARSTADTALGNRITAIDAIAKDAQSRISTAETAIANNAGAISQQKTDITAAYKQAISDIEIGGRNLMLTSEEYSRTLGRRYGGIEESFLGYINVGYVNAPKTTMSGFNQAYSESAVLGNNYTFSILATYVGAKPRRIQLYAFGGSYTALEGVENMQEGKWTRLTLTRTSISSDYTGSHHMHIYTEGDAPSKVYFTSAQVEKGNKVTDWTPAPEDVEAAIDTNTASIAAETTARADAVGSLASTVTALDSDYKGNKASVANSLTTLTNKDTALTNSLNALTTRVGTSETAITTETTARSTADTALGKRVDSVSGKTDNALSRISTAETAIANNAGAITQQKTDITAAYKEAIDDIEIGGRNLIHNSNSILLTPNNTGLGTSAIMNDEDYPYFRITANTQISTYESVILSWMKSNATTGEEYTISVDVRVPIAGDVGFYTWVGSQRVIADKWIRISYTFVYSGKRVGGLSYGANTLDYRNWKLEKGNKATDWTPAPEDIDNAIAANTASISSEATARSNAIESVTGLINTLDSEYKGNKATVASSLSTLTNKDTALTNSLTALTTRVGTAESTITTNNNALVAKDKSLTDSLTALTSDFNGNKTTVSNSLTALSTADTALGNRINSLTTTVGTNTTKIGQETTARTNADTTLGNRITTVEGKTDSALSRIGTVETIAASNTSSIASTKTDVTAAFKAISDIEMGGRNLLLDSGRTINNSSYLMNTYTVSEIIPHNQEITITVWGKLSPTRNRFQTYRTDGSSLVALNDLGNGIYSGTVKFNNPNNILLGLRLYQFTSSDTGDSTVYRIKLEKGNKATDWTPAPEDIEADYNAKISTEATARSDADTTLTNLITTLDTDYKGNKTAIRNELTAVSNKVNSTASSLSTLTTTVGGNTTKISQETTARSSADTALGNRITATDAIAKNAQSRVGTAETAISNNTSAIATTNTNLTTRFNEATDEIRGVELGTVNKIVNANFSRKSLSGWSNNGGATYDDTGGVSSAALKTTNGIYQNFSVSTAQYYEVRFRAKANDDTTGIKIGFLNLNSNYSQTISLTTAWKDYSFKTSAKVAAGNHNFHIYSTGKPLNITNIVVSEDLGSDITASVAAESKARSDADTALGSRITTLDTDYKGNKTAIRNELTAVSNKANSTANSLSTLTTTVGGNTTKISQESTARSTADTALGNRITATDAIAKDAQSRVGTAETAISNATSAIATLRTDLTASYSVADTRSTNQTPAWYQTNHPRQVVREFKTASAIGVSGGGYAYLETTVKYGDASGGNVTQEATSNVGTVFIRRGAGTTWQAWVEQEDVTGSAAKVAALKTALGKDISAVDARVTAEKKVAADATSALASTVSALDTDYKGNKTAIRTELTAVSNKTNSTATSVGTLQTTVNGHTSSIQTQQTSINGLNAQYTVKLDVGGRVSGFGLASSSTQSDFAVNADKFYIAPPSGSAKGVSPFMVLTSPKTINGVSVPAGTYMQSAFIHNGSIDTAHIRSAAVDTAKIDNLAVTSAKLDNLAVTRGKIANLAVDTLQIELEAVTVPRLFYHPWTRQIFSKVSHTLEYTLNTDAKLSRGSKNGLPEGDILTMSLGTATFDAMGGSVSIQAFADDLEYSIPDSYRGITGFDAVAGYCLFGLTLRRTDKAEPLREVTKVAWDTDRPQAPEYAKHSFTIPPVLDYPPSGEVTYEVSAWVYQTDRQYNRYTFKTIKNKVIISVGSVSVQIIGTKR